MKLKNDVPSPASVETPTYTLRCGPVFAFSVMLSGATNAAYRFPRLGHELLSTLICAAVLALFVGIRLPAAGSVAESIASPIPAVYVKPPLFDL